MHTGTKDEQKKRYFSAKDSLLDAHIIKSTFEYTNRHQDLQGSDQQEGYQEIFFQISWQNNRHQ